MSCYRFELIGTNDSPLMKNVDCTYILTMEDSSRVIDIDNALKLTCKTVKQINKGFKKCYKPKVTTPGKDLIHAYRNIAKSVIDTTDYERVLILEDDFVIETCDPVPYKEIDDFVSSNAFDVYSLGSFGVRIPFSKHHKILTLITTAGVIWSRKALRKLLDVDVDELYKLEHIDGCFIKKYLNTKYVYDTPLITQTFPETDNKKIWGKGQSFTDWMFKLDRRTQPAWNVYYFFCGKFIFIYIPIIIIVVLVYITQKLRRIRS